MLHEIAITPSVFRRDGYFPAELCDAHIQGIWEALTEKTLVRDLRDGEWFQALMADRSALPFQAQKILKALRKLGRLSSSSPRLADAPISSADWCSEALESHQIQTLAGILSCKEVKKVFQQEQLVASVENRSSSDWWNNCIISGKSGGPRVRRTIADYINQLDCILRYANHIMFLDPHLDPTRRDYGGFIQILQCIVQRNRPLPSVEIHRVCYEGSGQSRKVIDNFGWHRRFEDSWGNFCKSSGLKVRIVIWSDEHDRHLISNLLGIHIGNGFNTDEAPDAVSTWSRMSSSERDSIQREFDTNVRPRHVLGDFKIG